MILSNSEKIKSNTSDRMEEYIGNNKKYSICENKNHLRIIGNGNKISLTTNLGTLEVIGNSTNVRITNNCGSVIFIGNNGKIILGNESSIKSVKYVGSNGSIKLVPKDKSVVKKTAKVMSPVPLQTKHLSHEECSNLFDEKFNKFSNNYFSMNNVYMPNLRGFQVDLSNNIINIGQSNIVTNK